MGVLVILSGILNLILVILFLLFYFPQIYGPPLSTTVLYFVCYLVAYGITLPEVLVLTPKKDSSNQASMQSSGTKSDKAVGEIALHSI